MLTMIHQNPVAQRDGGFIVDRKFHTGMLEYVALLGIPVTTVNPQLTEGAAVMDPVTVALEDLPYETLILDVDRTGKPTPAANLRLEAAISASRLVYGQSYRAAEIARRAGVPYIALVEYDLPTRVSVNRSTVSSTVKKTIRGLKTRIDYLVTERPALLHATAVHCNGYPMYEQVMALRGDALLYLDSRIGADMVISHQVLRQRLDAMASRRLRLIYSGRFDPMKGALDAVRVGLACRERGLDFDFDLFGQGMQRDEMVRAIAQAGAGDQIRVHAPIPFAELFERSKTYDIFVCCHDQGDPSCTYLEAFGAGLPIVGYDNAMWRSLQAEADGGVRVPIGEFEEAADALVTLAHDRERLARLSQNARAFALEHVFEREFAKRIASLERYYAQSLSSAAA